MVSFIYNVCRSYWSTSSQFGDHVCNLSMETRISNPETISAEKRVQNPLQRNDIFASTDKHCSSPMKISISMTLKAFLRKNSSVSDKRKILIKGNTE